MTTFIKCGSEVKIIEFLEFFEETTIENIFESRCKLKDIKEIIDLNLNTSENSVIIDSNSLLNSWFNEIGVCEQSLIDKVFIYFPELNLHNVLVSQKLLSKLFNVDIKLQMIKGVYFYIMKRLEFPDIPLELKT